jgi:hypothetical protein
MSGSICRGQYAFAMCYDDADADDGEDVIIHLSICHGVGDRSVFHRYDNNGQQYINSCLLSSRYERLVNWMTNPNHPPTLHDM